MKKVIALLTLALILIGMTGCGLFEAKEKTFSKGSFSITLNDDFSEGDRNTYKNSYAFYESDYVHVMVMHESYDELGVEEDECTLDDYIQAILEANDRTSSNVKEDISYKYITYMSEEDGETMFYKVTFFKGAEGFYSVSFITNLDNLDSYGEKFEAWAESVVVD